MAKRKKLEPQEVNLNLTSMLDVVFQLIVFFLLVTNFTSAELPKLEVPEATSAIIDKNRDPYVTVNIIPQTSGSKGLADGSGQAKNVRVGTKDIGPGNYGELTLMLKEEKAKNDGIQVDLRADASIHYANVQPVMDAITQAGIGQINLVSSPEVRQK